MDLFSSRGYRSKEDADSGAQTHVLVNAVDGTIIKAEKELPENYASLRSASKALVFGLGLWPCQIEAQDKAQDQRPKTIPHAAFTSLTGSRPNSFINLSNPQVQRLWPIG
jgi:outer membrane protein TolC